MSQQDIVDSLIAEQGQLFSADMGVDLTDNTPEADFAWLAGTILLSARISHKLALQAGKALGDEGLLTIDALIDADARMLSDLLGDNGYQRYHITAVDYLKASATWVRDDLGGDLRKIAEGSDTKAALEAVQSAKGIGAVGAEIFAREAQLNWDVFYPRLEGPARDEAKALGLTTDHGALVSMAGSRERFVALTAALSRAKIDEPADSVLDAAQ